ncbi:hypothetical protein Tco_1150930, partial [Tanacetum coccineum]
DDSRSSLSRPRPDVVAIFLTPSLDRSRRRRFIPATSSPVTVCIDLQEIWCRIGEKNIRNIEHEVPNKCDDETVDITDYEDSDQEDGELPDLPTFSAANVFASIYEQVKEDIDTSIMKEKRRL